MKNLSRIVFAIALILSCVHTSSAMPFNAAIVGQWHFYKMVYQGKEMPPRDPNLYLEFDFSEAGESHLFWKTQDKSTFCERRGSYYYDEPWLMDEIQWVNPNNTDDCATDPDMQMGHTTWTKAWMENGEFRLQFKVGDDDLVYVWKKVDNGK